MSTVNIIGELINNSYARARNAFAARDVKGYQELARLQAGLGARYLTLNLDRTARLEVRPEEMLAFLPDVIAAIQEAVDVPLSFDSPSADYHRVALRHYDRKRSGAPIVNSVAASRERLDEMLELVQAYDTNVVVMASERSVPGGTAQCLTAADTHAAAKGFVELLAAKAGRRNDQILIDPGLPPVGADTYGLVNVGLDAMRMISHDPDLRGAHFVVGLSNFAWGTPKGLREQLERAYLTLGREVGLDYALANPEKAPAPLEAGHPLVARLRAALESGRPQAGETQETAGYRQAEALMDICTDFAPKA